MFAIVAGGAALSWQGRLAWGGAAGPLLIVCACLGWAIDNNLTQKVSASDPVQIAAIKGLVAGSVNLSIGLALGGGVPALPPAARRARLCMTTITGICTSRMTQRANRTRIRILTSRARTVTLISRTFIIGMAMSGMRKRRARHEWRE